MDKTAKAYADLFDQLIPESPLTEAFRRWNETAKQIEIAKKIEIANQIEVVKQIKEGRKEEQNEK